MKNGKKLFKKILKIASALIITTILLPVLIFYKSDIPVSELKAEFTDGRSQFIEINGVNVHYRTEGNGPDLLLLHGTSSSLHTWDRWTDLLKNDFRITRLDLPAFGLTGPTPGHKYSADDYAGFLDLFTEKLKIQKAHVAGNSLGGLIAFNFAALFSEKVDKLILINTAGISTGRTPVIFKLANLPVISTIMTKVTPRSMIKDNLEQVYYDDSKITNELVDRYFKLTLREGNRDAFVARARHKRDFVMFQKRLQSLESPTLIMWGRHDQWIPVEHAEQYSQLIRNTSVKIFENAGHIPMEEIPEESAQAALEFLKK